jgi:hypothetical protein
MKFLPLSRHEEDVVRKVLLSTQVQNLIGAEEWVLTEKEENTLWEIINRIKD